MRGHDNTLLRQLMSAIAILLALAAPARAHHAVATHASQEACHEWVAFLAVPAERVRERVPARYRLLYEEDGKASVFVRAFRCERAVADGRTIERLAGGGTGVEVKPVDGQGTLNFYTFAQAANSTAWVDWMKHGSGFSARLADVRYAFDPSLAVLEAPLEVEIPGEFAIRDGTAQRRQPGALPLEVNWWEDTPSGVLKLQSSPHRNHAGIASGTIVPAKGSVLASIVGEEPITLSSESTGAVFGFYDAVEYTRRTVAPSDHEQCARAQVSVHECVEHAERVRAATRKYQDPALATADGFVPTNCVDGSSESPPEEGAMGEHWVNFDRIDGRVSLEEPEILLYVPAPEGKRLAAVEWSIAEADAPAGPPRLFGRPFDGPMDGHNPIQPPHYDLHVWLWEHNPGGLFDHYNPRLSCAPS